MVLLVLGPKGVTPPTSVQKSRDLDVFDGRTDKTYFHQGPSVHSAITNCTDWWTEWMDGSLSISIRPSVHQSVHSVHHTWTENRHFLSMFATVWWTKWTDWWTDWWTETERMDGRTLVEVGFVRQSIKNVQIPAFLDDFYGRTDGWTLVEALLKVLYQGFICIACMTWSGPGSGLRITFLGMCHWFVYLFVELHFSPNHCLCRSTGVLSFYRNSVILIGLQYEFFQKSLY